MFNQIQYFISVVKNKNFTKAADECHISQPAISQQIKELESTLGVELLTRKGRSFEVTEAGRYFYAHGQDIINNVNELIKETRQIGGQAEEPYVLHAGYLRNFGTDEFLKAVSEFSAQYPDVKLKITSGSHEELFNELENGDLDIAFSDLRRAPSNKYVNEYLTESDFEVLLNKRFVKSGQSNIEAGDLQELPCILVVGPNEQADEEKYCREVLGIDGEFVLASTYDEATLMATLGQGYLIINNRVRKHINLNDNLVSLPLYVDGQEMKQKYYAFWQVDNSGYYVESFSDLLKEQFKN